MQAEDHFDEKFSRGETAERQIPIQVVTAIAALAAPAKEELGHQKEGFMLDNRNRQNAIRALRVKLPAVLLLAIVAWAFAASGSLRSWYLFTDTAQAFGAQQQDPCYTQSVSLSTGYNHATGAVHAIGEADSNWQIVAPDPGGGVVPRPAGVINKHGAWASALPNSQWISSYPTATNNLNADYWLEISFCLRPRFTNAKLDLRLLADDEAEVYLNGANNNNHIGSSYSSSTSSPIVYTNGPLFVVGKNYLRVKLRNTGAVAMGLNIAGTVTADGLLGGTGLLTAECCNPGGKILGAKWNDLDGDGVWDTGEPGLPGWQINLSNGQTADARSEFGEHGVRLLRHAGGQRAALGQAGEGLDAASLPPLRWLAGSPASFEVKLLSAPGATVRLEVVTRR